MSEFKPMICPLCGEMWGMCGHFAKDYIPELNKARTLARQFYTRAMAAEHELAAETALYQAERAGLLQVIADLRADIADMNAAER